MKAILVAGGYGTRLQPLTHHIPKCLVKVGGVPILDIWLAQLFTNGFSEVLINTHYLAELVESHIRKSKWIDRVTVVHEPELLGTAGTLKANYSFWRGEDILFAHADNLCLTDWRAFKATFLNRAAHVKATLMLFHTSTPSSCGMVEINREMELLNYVEKPEAPWEGSLANAAVMFLSEPCLQEVLHLPEYENDVCRDYLPTLLGRANCFVNEQTLIDIGTPKSLALANEVVSNDFIFK
ncbi:nucleotidyltransferase family protein [Planctobacterium marinum]|uniref:nucleotidyltransferase family protein n=1 Tax=Planctobacterium marinum TaxID=1631968 RepID=UPI001E5AB3F9|nr:nucleotidyltransferase family protein [Planctobacterium marinum]MCC2606236.1 nucleotidyltransferase family protein [Planctobacterium marinum]